MGSLQAETWAGSIVLGDPHTVSQPSRYALIRVELTG
jgi:hypothetical protein